ncbi:MAG: RNA helicase [Synechococcus sp.]|nr:RNA helicase [Synechococcus sp.]
MNDESRWSGSRWSESRRGADPLEQRLDRWVSAGRQLVDGVSGARPGSRPAARGGPARGGPPGGSLPRLDNLGRWMEDKLDWLLEDGDDWREPWEQPEPSGEMRRRPEPRDAEPRVGARAGDPRTSSPRRDEPRFGSGGSVPSGPARSNRRPLEAISRRGAPALRPAATFNAPAAEAAPATAEAAEGWPSDDDFSLPRWQRPSGPPASNREESPGSMPAPNPAAAGRPLPRSSRRRPT